MAYDLNADPKRLLTVDGNPKLAKGEGWLIAGLHLSPSNLAGAGRTMCPYASPGCIAACLNYSGHGQIGLDADGLNGTQVARIRRTRAFVRDQRAFMLRLVFELEAFERKAIRKGLRPAVRLNVLSDNLWERIRVGRHRNIMAMFPGITFYDYTKVPVRYRADRVGAINNYSLTFSLSETNESEAEAALLAGMNVAVPFNLPKGAPLPGGYRIGRTVAPVIDGDISDMRFLDSTGMGLGAIVGLRVKGSNGKADKSGFIREPVPAF